MRNIAFTKWFGRMRTIALRNLGEVSPPLQGAERFQLSPNTPTKIGQRWPEPTHGLEICFEDKLQKQRLRLSNS